MFFGKYYLNFIFLQKNTFDRLGIFKNPNVFPDLRKSVLAYQSKMTELFQSFQQKIKNATGVLKNVTGWIRARLTLKYEQLLTIMAIFA